ncbi:MAG TPA: HlyD family secretion protein, partial [Planctomycetota bacterium]|nr:HlyD family secretion protein [Planctomycetota bacterium]
IATGSRPFVPPMEGFEAIQQEIARLHFEVAASTAQIEQDKAELAKVTRRLSKDRSLAAPISGIVWSIDASSGESLRAGDPVIQLLDVSKRWVETYVSESDVDRITVGSPATVYLGGKVPLNARVETIRTGLGRVTRDEAVSIPAFTTRPQVVVRLAVRWPDALTHEWGSDQFYGVGRSVEVLFN